MLCSSETIFENCKQEYEYALKNAGYSQSESKLRIQNNAESPKEEAKRTKRKRKNRKILWFTHPGQTKSVLISGENF